MVIIENTEGIIFKPNKKEATIQGVRTLVSTPIGSVPLMRDFGIDFSFIDKPADVAMQLFSAEVYKALAKYFPEEKIKRIEYEKKENAIFGQFYPKIILE